MLQQLGVEVDGKVDRGLVLISRSRGVCTILPNLEVDQRGRGRTHSLKAYDGSDVGET